jgi:FtsH-binding integral membrane protein
LAALPFFAWQTKIEFTAVEGVHLVALLCLLIIGIVALCDRSEILFIAYVSLVAFIFSCYIIYDTWWMLKGGHSYVYLDPDEYIFALLDLVSLIFQMLQNSKNSKH